MATQLKAVVGLNIVTDTGEVRYEPGDVVKVAHVEPWMVDEGVVSDGKTKPPKVPVVDPVEVIEPDGDALIGDSADRFVESLDDGAATMTGTIESEA